jgi:enolase
MKLSRIWGQEILDSRGWPTLSVTAESDSGNRASFGVPAGQSTGRHEAVELRDGGDRYEGLGVQGCLNQLERLKSKLHGQPLGDQERFDDLLIGLDGTSNKSHLGGNTMLGLSGVYLRLSAYEAKQAVWEYIAQILGSQPAFPRLFANLINGGKHAPGLDIQELMAVPIETRPAEAVPLIQKIYRLLGERLSAEYGPSARLIGDEGGYAPAGISHAAAWRMLRDVAGDKADLACDAAANNLVSGSGYQFEGRELSAMELAEIYGRWGSDFGLISVEDPFAEEDSAAYKLLASSRDDLNVIGDDLTVTNSKRILSEAKKATIQGTIIKPNQTGTITETFKAIEAAREANIDIIVSHRSGETNDDFVADLAYGAAANGLKLGAPARGERIAKYNRLLTIELEVDSG